jgi:hypothetical protein
MDFPISTTLCKNCFQVKIIFEFGKLFLSAPKIFGTTSPFGLSYTKDSITFLGFCKEKNEKNFWFSEIFFLTKA